jgi:NAD-dependent deacetylase
MGTIDDALRVLHGRNRILVFTGAGISTDSGIPDFRGPEGLWTKEDPADFTIERYLADPEVRRRAWQRRVTIGFLDATPNRGHLAVTRLWESGRMVGCITQNVDSLHRAAGLPESALAELHGSAATTSCLACGATVPTGAIRERLESGEDDPPCRACGGILKADVVLFGEILPRAAMARAAAMAETADAVIAVGTTLGVYPAAGFPLTVASRGMPFVIINQGRTDLDDLADAIVAAPAADALETLVSRLG